MLSDKSSGIGIKKVRGTTPSLKVKPKSGPLPFIMVLQIYELFFMNKKIPASA
jgi:hypothetical protein|nr:MAG TPA: hypothetical protein [Caudoviricetes sp.]